MSWKLEFKMEKLIIPVECDPFWDFTFRCRKCLKLVTAMDLISTGNGDFVYFKKDYDPTVWSVKIYRHLDRPAIQMCPYCDCNTVQDLVSFED